jgi:hypothetical protein
MFASGRIPVYLFVMIVFLLLIVTFNYWKLMEKNKMFKKSLYVSEEKLNELIERKVHVEKQVEINEKQMKFYKTKFESTLVTLKQKEKEINELISNLKIKDNHYNRLNFEIKELRTVYVFFYKFNLSYSVKIS